MSDPSYPFMSDIITAVEAEMIPGGRPLNVFLATDAMNSMPQGDWLGLLLRCLNNVEARVRAVEHLNGVG